MARLFGTDGVRGIANTELTCDLAFRLGQASAYVLASDVHRPTILVGRDTRLSGEMLESALVAGICSVGARAVLVEVLPTPAIAYLTRFYEADAGAVISASHNTVEYNGIKFFDKNGYKLPDAIEDRIEEIVTGGMPADFEMPIDDFGQQIIFDDLLFRCFLCCIHIPSINLYIYFNLFTLKFIGLFVIK